IDLLQWFMGGAVSVNGMIKTVSHDIETEDLGVALVEYANGAVGVIEGSTAVVPGFKERIEIHGERGSIVLEGGNIREWKVTGSQESDHVIPEKVVYGETNSPAISYVNHHAQLEEVVQAFLEGKEPLINGEEGLKSLQIVRGIYDSADERRRIEL
ncbi:MAG TPA: Gfo/Idh/MocA family oxidoreductase, partial [Bacillota bacterium]|nr:Gfo/Idh/MocA family oxidoreductase [Bacillota bacterium]